MTKHEESVARASNDNLRLFHGPVYDTPHGPLQTYHTGAEDRSRIARTSKDIPALRDALASPDLQKTVAGAIRHRLRQLWATAEGGK